jgi:plasmid stabilization system protein ParE
MASKPKPIVFSPQAIQDLDDLYAYLDRQWGKKVIANFDKKMNAFLQNVSFHPRLFAYINKRKNLRKYLLYKKNLVIYKVSMKRIEIVAIIDASESPKKLRQVIKNR